MLNWIHSLKVDCLQIEVERKVSHVILAMNRTKVLPCFFDCRALNSNKSNCVNMLV